MKTKNMTTLHLRKSNMPFDFPKSLIRIRRLPNFQLPQNTTRIFFLAAVTLLLLLTQSSTFAGSGTWLLNPGSADWNTPTNWSSGTVPNSSTDTATFATSNTTSVGISASTDVAGITFNSGASAFTITVEGHQDLFFDGTGITNNSGVTQNFVAANVGGLAGDIFFEGANSTAGSLTHFTDTASSTMGSINSGTFFDGTSSTAGSATFVQTGSTVTNGFGGFVVFEGTSQTAGTATFINQAGGPIAGGGGFTEFDGDGTLAGRATAGSATITNEGGATDDADGQTYFNSFSTAGSAMITNNGGTGSGANGGTTFFNNNSTAGNATITNNAATVSGAIGGSTQFFNSSTASGATLIANGGSGGAGGGFIVFTGSSTGSDVNGAARVEVFGNGYLDINTHNAPGVTIGSLEGSGNAFLGNRNLTVGSLNTSTTFSGVIQDGAPGGGGLTGGSLTKSGTGRLTLSGANTYTGATTVNAGTLLVNGSITSNVTVNNSGTTLGGGVGATAGTITGTVAVNAGANLHPGTSPGILNTGSVSLVSTSNFSVDINGTTVGTQYSQLNVTGTVTLSGTCNLVVTVGGALTVGQNFIIVNNDLSDAVSGTFAQGSTVTGSNGDVFSINYAGGDGNDIELSVVSAPTPEPSTWVAGALVFAALAYTQRRRFARLLRKAA
jgi:autotransporter-associated beta strand protein